MNSIAFLIPSLSRHGGAERQTAQLAGGLAKRDWRVSVVTLANSDEEERLKLGAQGVACIDLSMRKGLADPRGWMRLCLWLRANRPDIVHAHLPHAAWMARWSRLFAPARVVIDTIHTAGTGAAGRRLGYRWSNWLTDHVTAVSHGAADAWLMAQMVPADKLTILPNGIDTELWKPDPRMRIEIRKQLGIGDTFLWLAAGRLEPVKDFPTLLRAFAQLPAQAHLVLAGSGSQERELRSLATHLGLADRVRFPGFEPDLRRWMQAADGFALSSLWEGLPMSLLEAGACGLPSVATEVAGANEILAGTHNGFLARVGDPASLAAAMTRLMNLSGQSRQSMGQAARETVIARYSLPDALDQWEHLYASLLAGHPHASRTGDARISRASWTMRVSERGAGASATGQPLPGAPHAHEARRE